MDRHVRHDLWSDDAHWSGGIYFCKRDPRLWVPKRIRWAGLTINFGHRLGTPALLSLILLPFLVLLGIFLVTVFRIEAS